MARVSRALIALAVLPILLPQTVAGQTSAYRPPTWFAPHIVEDKTFPVLLPADGRWLNWEDTFGAPRMRLIDGTWQQVGVHQGIDIFAEEGTPIVSMSAGKVENVGWTFYSGWRVGIRGNDGHYYFYAHLKAGSPDSVVKGARVAPGALLGHLGNSGYGPIGTSDEFPPHLHFGLQAGSEWVNSFADLKSLYDQSVSRIRAEKAKARSASPEEREAIEQNLMSKY